MVTQKWLIHGLYKVPLEVFAQSAFEAVALCARGRLLKCNNWCIKEEGVNDYGQPFVIVTIGDEHG